MLNNAAVQIIEKPDWVSWDEIKQCLYEAHAINREKGINMLFSTYSGEKIKKIIGANGKMFVALSDGKVVGTAAIKVKDVDLWCGRGDYAYLCFASVLSEYSGRGIYHMLLNHIEREAQKMDLDKIMFETHEKNCRMLTINSKNGYKKVDMKVTTTDHYNVYMVKWFNNCPYSDFYCKCQFLIRNYYKRFRFKPGRVKRFGI